MNDYFNRVYAQINEFLKNLSTGKKIAMLVLTAAICITMAWLFIWTENTTYTQLMSNLNGEDSTNIIRILREKHIPFKLDQSGRNISIPSENLYELRLELATMGLPQSSVVGYEVFDKQTLGTSSFVQKVNQKRAQEGELMRTINTIKGVRRSRVHLAIPSKSAFMDEQKKSTASVVLDLEPGIQLTEKQVYGIGNLVARAIEGLESTDVLVMNSDGKVLSKNPTDPLSAATASQLEFEQKIETEMQSRIESILSHIVGEGHVAAKVTADIDFSQINETQTLFDSDGAAVRSVEKHNDSMSGTRPGPNGNAGSTTNLPGQILQNSNNVKTETAKNNEVTNFEIPQTIRKTSKAIGSIKKLSVAVVIDGKQVKTTDKDGKMTIKNEVWPEDKLKEFEVLVSNTVGLDKKRGDSLEIKTMEFKAEDFEEAQRLITEKETKTHMENMITYGVIGLAVLMFFLFVVRPFIKWMVENTVDSVDTFLPQTVEELERLQKNVNLPNLEEVVPVLPESLDPNKVEGEMIKEKIITLVEANPHKAALILRDWLHGESKKRAAAAAAAIANKAVEEGKGKEKGLSTTA